MVVSGRGVGPGLGITRIAAIEDVSQPELKSLWLVRQMRPAVRMISMLTAASRARSRRATGSRSRPPRGSRA